MPDDNWIIEICRDDEYFFGKILWMQETEEDGSPIMDKENPVNSLQTREVAELKVINNFKYNGDNPCRCIRKIDFMIDSNIVKPNNLDKSTYTVIKLTWKKKFEI